ncbi:MAG TPA: hypothetical protein PKD68_02375 [Candidatus Saccharibacteria bacterium]|nr:hypothetical protein [Candidatus Saccharibacteria bacterium]
MLKIKQKIRLQLPQLTFWPRRLELSKPVVDEDELIDAINTDTETHDDNWQLTEHADANQLVEYWGKVEDDILHDPEWQRIDD